MDNNAASFGKDKDMAKLLDFLSQMENHEGYEKLMETISYADSLEDTLSSMMKQIVDMREEIKSVSEQNEYLVSRIDRGVKAILADQLKKAEQKIQVLYGTLTEVRNDLKKFASDTVQKAKMIGNMALLKLVDITHFKQALVGIMDKADRVAGSIDSLSDMVEGYKARAEYESEHRAESHEIKESASYDREDDQVSAVAEEQPVYQQGEAIGTYEEEMQKFMANRVSEGVIYECNQDAYEDFKTYYDKKRRAVGPAGGEHTAVHRKVDEIKR